MPRWADTEVVTEHVVPGAGHLVAQDAPDEVTGIMMLLLSSSSQSFSTSKSQEATIC